ncbi:hypothetical protein CU098_006114 [Rhizopus stolonifer]|uniref:Uncharacterized protein n=1 Tax=Rhizopus stolonifer TaxID=4846 RepID=A0A367JET7_RHIST|nr:hypothetical protein CU098_006114 [Rhizopus stolonifer]
MTPCRSDPTMVLPANQHFSSRIVAAKKRISLIHKDIQQPHVEAEDQPSTLQPRIYRSAESPGALLLDLTEIRSEYTDFQSLQIVLEQHSKIYGCQFPRDGPRRYLELYIRPKDDENDIINTGVILTTKENSSSSLSLEQSLAPFGKIMNVDITTEPKLGIFMGSGYAVIAGADLQTKSFIVYGIICLPSVDITAKRVIISLSVNNLEHESSTTTCPRKAPLNPSKKRRTPASKKQNIEGVLPHATKEYQPAPSTKALRSQHAPKDQRVVLPRTKKNLKSTIAENYISAFDISETDGSNGEGSDYMPSEFYDSDSDSAREELEAESGISAMELDAVKEDAMTALADLLPVQMKLKMSLMQQIHQLQKRVAEGSLSETERNNLIGLYRQLTQLEETI